MNEQDILRCYRFVCFSQMTIHKDFFRDCQDIAPEQLKRSLTRLERYLIVEYDNMYRLKNGLSRIVKPYSDSDSI